MFATVCLYLGGVNLASFGAFALDKRAAIRGDWRIRESTLLTLAALGGTFGAVLAQTTLRHKTRKEPFRTLLYGIIALQLAALAALAFPQVRAALG